MIFATASDCLAKIGNPRAVFWKWRFFCSHANHVSAIKTSNRTFECGLGAIDSIGTRKVWETELPFKVEPEKYEADLEQDVQWCIVTALAIDGSDIVATNRKGEKYRLDQKSVELKKTNNL